MVSDLWQNPLVLFALIAVLAMIVAGIHIKRIKFTTSMLVYIAMMLAMTLILHQIRLYHFPQGGSVTPGSMVPLILVAYRYGVPVGMLAGFICGFVVLLLDPFIVHPLQVIFDYPLPYMAVGLAGIWSHKRRLATALAFVCRYAAHFVSGVAFFGAYAPEGTSPVVYSLVANATYMVPECLICALILKYLPIERLLSAMDRHREN